MKSPFQTILLAIAIITIAANYLRAQADIKEDSTYASPLNRMFDDQYNIREETPSQKLNRKALQAIGEKEWKEAFTSLMAAIKEDPNDVVTFINFGIFHFAREEYPSSEKALLKALQIDSNNAKAHYHYSKVMFLKGEKELAFQSAQLAIDNATPTDWKYAVWLGDLNERESNFGEAAAKFSEALVLLEEKLKFVSDAIKSEEKKQEIIETYTEVEIISDKNGIREVEVDKFRTDYKEAPEEWHQVKANYEKQIDSLTQRREQVLNKANL